MNCLNKRSIDNVLFLESYFENLIGFIYTIKQKILHQQMFLKYVHLVYTI